MLMGAPEVKLNLDELFEKLDRIATALERIDEKLARLA